MGGKRFLLTQACAVSMAMNVANTMLGFPFGPLAETAMFGFTALAAGGAFLWLINE